MPSQAICGADAGAASCWSSERERRVARSCVRRRSTSRRRGRPTSAAGGSGGRSARSRAVSAAAARRGRASSAAPGLIETDYLNGEIVLRGRQVGVPTPVNELLQGLMREMLRDRHAPGGYPRTRCWHVCTDRGRLAPVRVAIAGAHGKIAMRLATLLDDPRRRRGRAHPQPGPRLRGSRGRSGARGLRPRARERSRRSHGRSGDVDAVVFAAGAGAGSGAARKLTMDRDGAIKLLDATAPTRSAYVIVSAVGAESPAERR